jgi:PAS domain-containing protein
MTVQLTATEYRLLVQHSPVMIWRAGLDAKCDYFNDTWRAFTGRTLAQDMATDGLRAFMSMTSSAVSITTSTTSIAAVGRANRCPRERR